MRVLVYGAGAIGGSIGARLAAAGHEVTLIARGEHLQAIQADGLRIDCPDGSQVVHVPAFEHPKDGFKQGDVVILAMKGDGTAAALTELRGVADADTPVVCAQNGVNNERQALRFFKGVYSVCVRVVAEYLEPGRVVAYSSPITGLLDIGRYPAGSDSIAESLSEAFRGATFASEVRPDILRWKYHKLIGDLQSVVGALCPSDDDRARLVALLRAEGRACFAAAGIDTISDDDARRRDSGVRQSRPVDGKSREGASSWQSLQRSTGSIETDFLNGEIVLLGRLHGVPTPANELVQELAVRVARSHQAPGSVPARLLLDRLA